MGKIEEKRIVKPIGIRRNGHPIQVVVVDDVFIDRRIMTQILRSTGFEVLAEAENGEEGLYAIEEVKPQLVVLDYMMPKMNGLVTLQQIKKRFPDIRVVMSTSESERELAIQLIKEGASDYIVKPLDRPLVLDKLRKIVRDINESASLRE